MTFALFILSVLNIISELTELSYDLRRMTRRHLVPVLVGTYVLLEMGWDYLTTYEFSVKFRNTPLLTGFSYGSV